MQSAYENLGYTLAHTPVQTPRFAVVSNVTGAEVSTPDEIKAALQEQVTATVRWVDCMQRLLDRGCDFFIELGPGNVLASLLQRIRKGTLVVSVSDSATLQTAVERLQAVA